MKGFFFNVLCACQLKGSGQYFMCECGLVLDMALHMSNAGHSMRDVP